MAQKKVIEFPREKKKPEELEMELDAYENGFEALQQAVEYFQSHESTTSSLMSRAIMGLVDASRCGDPDWIEKVDGSLKILSGCLKGSAQ